MADQTQQEQPTDVTLQEIYGEDAQDRPDDITVRGEVDEATAADMLKEMAKEAFPDTVSEDPLDPVQPTADVAEDKEEVVPVEPQQEPTEFDELLGLAPPEGGSTEAEAPNLDMVVKLGNGQDVSVKELVSMAEAMEPMVKRFNEYDEYFQNEMKSLDDNLPPMPEDTDSPEGEKALLRRFEAKERNEKIKASRMEQMKKNAELFEKQRQEAHLEGARRSEALLVERHPSLSQPGNMEKYYKTLVQYGKEVGLPVEWIIENQQYPEVMAMMNDAVIQWRTRASREKVKAAVPKKDTSHLKTPSPAPVGGSTGSTETSVPGLTKILDGTLY